MLHRDANMTKTLKWGWYVTWQRQQKQCSFHIWCPVPLEPAKCKRNTKHLNLEATQFHSWLIKMNYRRTPSCLWVWSHRIQQERPEPSRATPKYLSSVWSKMHYPRWVDVIFWRPDSQWIDYKRLQHWFANALTSRKESFVTDRQTDLFDNLVGGMGKAEVNLTKGLVRRLLKIEDHIVQDRLGWNRVSWWSCPGFWKMWWWLFWGNGGEQLMFNNLKPMVVVIFCEQPALSLYLIILLCFHIIKPARWER